MRAPAVRNSQMGTVYLYDMSSFETKKPDWKHSYSIMLLNIDLSD